MAWPDQENSAEPPVAAAGLGWSLVSGRWYNGPGQVVVSTAFASDTHRATGNNVTLTVNGKPISVRIAGEVCSFLTRPPPSGSARRPSVAGPVAWPSISTTWASRRAPARGSTPTHCSGH